MKRIFGLFMLIALSSSAHAGNSVSFMVGGHRVHVEAPRNCNSVSCVSVSIPGIYQTLRKLDRDDNVASAADAAPVKPVAGPAQPASAPIVVPAKPDVQPVASVPPPPSPPAKVEPAAPAKLEVAAPAPTIVEPAKARASLMPALAAAMPPAADAAPKISRVSHDADDDAVADTPLGVWQPEGKNELVRIERCGRALCGYVLKSSSDLSGEPVLINMKPKPDSEWSGNIYSRDSGNAYYATIAMKGSDSLRVEACALGHFFCSGNVWSRIDATPQKLISSRQLSSQPRS
jgi:uncharacterized protein (DUF2147 family)